MQWENNENGKSCNSLGNCSVINIAGKTEWEKERKALGSIVFHAGKPQLNTITFNSTTQH